MSQRNLMLIAVAAVVVFFLAKRAKASNPNTSAPQTAYPDFGILDPTAGW